MDPRVASLESEVRRLSSEVESLKSALWSLEFEQRERSLIRVVLAVAVVVTLVLQGVMWIGFGWI